MKAARWPAAFAFLALACGTADRDAGPVVTDSAGVSIIQNTEAQLENANEWRLTAEPLVDIGVVDGDSAYQFFTVYAGVLLSDGRLAIANGGSGEIRFYDASGRYLSATGGAGEGPGEFRDLQGLWQLRSDSLLAYDFGLQRLTLFDPAGTFARFFEPEPVDGRQAFVLNVFGDGSLLVMGAPIFGEEGATTGIVRTHTHMLRYDDHGVPVDTFGRFLWGEAFRLVQGDDFRMTSLPFARISRNTTSQSHLFFGEAASYEIGVYALDGTLERLIRLDRPNRPVTAEHIAAFREEAMERAGEEGSGPTMERMLAEMPFPEAMPPYQTMRMASDGHLWVQDYPVPGATGSRWTIFDPDGHLAGFIELPDRVAPLHIDGDRLLAVWLDDLDVEHVRVYGVERPAGPD